MQQKQVLITGGTGGLGLATVEYFAGQGWHVFCADFNRPALSALEGKTNITPVYVNVTDKSSVEALFAKVSEMTDGLDGIVNMAGINEIASLVEIEEDVFMRVMNVNFIGTYRMNKTFLPMLLKRKGRIINTSSETGWQSSTPLNGAYSISKHAIEAYSDSLRREMMFLGLQVVKIQPGAFRTSMVTTLDEVFAESAKKSALFKPQIEKMRGLAAGEVKKASEPSLLAKVIYHAMTTPRPKVAYSVKADTLRSLLQLLPARWVDELFYRILS